MYTKTHVQNKTGFIEILEHVHNLDIICLAEHRLSKYINYYLLSKFQFYCRYLGNLYYCRQKCVSLNYSGTAILFYK